MSPFDVGSVIRETLARSVSCPDETVPGFWEKDPKVR